MSSRPKRRMPSQTRILRYWGIEEPRCFRCLVPTRGLERAHLVDRWDGGLDGAQNIALLCQSCHAQMRVFRNGDGERALKWAMTFRESGFHEVCRETYGSALRKEYYRDNLPATIDEFVVQQGFGSVHELVMWAFEMVSSYDEQPDDSWHYEDAA